jgi:RNA polymerase sigma-70 factor (ECF subfamily)
VAFVAGLMSRYPVQEARLTQANGEPAIWTVIGGQRQLVAFDIRDGRVHAIYGVLNPDKLTRAYADR